MNKIRYKWKDFLGQNKDKLWEEAKKHTKVNSKGQTTISREDDDFYDDCWDEGYSEW